jgi:NAD(P)-dependent dehydrogenase (short-subunit alcohol dehydrogenase family)
LILSIPREGQSTVAVPPEQAHVFRPDGSYIVTGGLGGLGLFLASKMSAAGAGRVVLNSRSQPKPAALAEIARMRAAGTEVEVVSGGRTRILPSPSSSHVFDSGSLRDGEHRLTFLAGGRRSATTVVRVRFDNAAPTAHIREPRGAVARGTVHVSGMAIEGATVSVAGTPLTLDGDRRFDGDVGAPADLDALAIRFSHPRSGVHYYLRRVAP